MYDFQTFWTGITAIIVAILGIIVAKGQYDQQVSEKEEKDRVLRQRMIASMPIALSEVIGLTDRIIELMMLIMDHRRSNPVVSSRWQSVAPTLSIPQISTLSAAAAVANDNLSRNILKMLHQYQVMIARADSSIEKFSNPVPGVAYDHVGDACAALSSVMEVRRRAEMALEVVRGYDNEPECQIFESLYSELEKISIGNQNWHIIIVENRHRIH